MTQPFDPQQPYTAPLPPKKSHKFRNVALAVLAVFVIIAIAQAAGKKSDSPAAAVSSGSPVASDTAASSGPDGSDAKQDVAITSCTPADGGLLGAKVRITNHSAKPSTYLITVLFESKDGKEQLDSGPVSVEALANGQVSNQDALSVKAAPKAGYSCKVGDVTRMAS